MAFAALYWLVHGRFFEVDLPERVAGSSWEVAASLFPDVVDLVRALVRILGAAVFMASVMLMGIAATSFRKREPWAWYVMWSLPCFALLHFSILLGYHAVTLVSSAWDGVLFVGAVAALLTTDVQPPRLPKLAP
jgi:hypothetical protein